MAESLRQANGVVAAGAAADYVTDDNFDSVVAADDDLKRYSDFDSMT